MRVLVLTNGFAEFAGSEIVAIEVAEWFRDRGDAVTIAANHIARPMKGEAKGITLTDSIAALQLSDFDLVWCQHDLLCQVPFCDLEQVAEAGVPHVALVSLSPYEPLEHLNAFIAEAFSAEMHVNSQETRDEMLRRNPGILDQGRIYVFSNAAPEAFHAARRTAPPKQLKHLTLVSNHPPQEMLAALESLSAQGVAIRILGKRHEWKRVKADDLAGTDSIVSIGKTVVYGLALGLPVYIYDHYGGDGWLTSENLARNAHHNYSGRPSCRRLQADRIAAEILDGFAMAFRAGGEEAPRLDLSLHALRERALARSPVEAAAQLKAWLQAPGTRGLHEALHHKSLVMRRSYRAHRTAIGRR